MSSKSLVARRLQARMASALENGKLASAHQYEEMLKAMDNLTEVQYEQACDENAQIAKKSRPS